MKDTTVQLELMIDSEGLTSILEQITEICHEKADHILTNYQDRSLAAAWTRNAELIDKLTTRIEPTY